MTVKEEKERLERVARDAVVAFWMTVAKEYPEARSGDLGWDVVIEFDMASQEIIQHWLDANVR